MRPLKGARQCDLDLLSEEEYHFPVPIHRIVRRMKLFGGVVDECGDPVQLDTDNILLKAFINVHTPTMKKTTRVRYEKEIKKYLDKAYICPGEGVGIGCSEYWGSAPPSAL